MTSLTQWNKSHDENLMMHIQCFKRLAANTFSQNITINWITVWYWIFPFSIPYLLTTIYQRNHNLPLHFLTYVIDIQQVDSLVACLGVLWANWQQFCIGYREWTKNIVEWCVKKCRYQTVYLYTFDSTLQQEYWRITVQHRTVAIQWHSSSPIPCGINVVGEQIGIQAMALLELYLYL